MTAENKQLDYSIVICTYNPDERLLKRCLNAINNLDRTGLLTEVIIVDNNSRVPVDSLSYVRNYFGKIPSLRILFAVKQGLKYARIEAITAAKGKHLVYFDYDNEPEKNYLQELKKLNDQFPQVAAIGPGDITVDFIDGIDKKIEDYARFAFQERHEEKITFSGVHEWQPCYPFSSGLCTLTEVMKKFALLANMGKFTVVGKRGNELNSEEDTQMVLHCISEGFFAGVSPKLRIKHVIHKERANYNYLKRFSYGIGLYFESCQLKVFPDHVKKLKKEKISPSKFSGLAIQKFLKARFGLDQDKMFELVQFIGLNAGTYLALNKPVPAVVKKMIKSLKLVE